MTIVNATKGLKRMSGSARRRGAAVSIRMDEVARRAGVSTITVSRVLNKPEKVRPTTRARVLAAIEETGYIPNLVAGSLASSRTRSVGVIVPTVTNSIFADKIEGLSDVLGARGYHLLLASSGYSLESEANLAATFAAQRPAGLVVTGVTHAPRMRDLVRRAGLTIVETWNVSGDPIDMLVGFSNERAAYAMVRHLAAAGYAKIGFVSALIRDNDRAADRLAGYRRGVRELGLTCDPALERQASFSFRNGALALVDLVEAHPDIEAIFFANDILAAGALLECRRRGWPVPERIAIAGFDDVELASQLEPALTTVRIPRYEIGAEAARLLLARLDGAAVPSRIRDLGFEIVPRGSTASGAAVQARPPSSRIKA